MLSVCKRVWALRLGILLLLLIATAITLWGFDVPLRIEFAVLNHRYANGDISLQNVWELIGKKTGTPKLLKLLDSNDIDYMPKICITWALGSNMVNHHEGIAARDGLVQHMYDYGVNEQVAFDCALVLCTYNVPETRDKLLESVVALKRPLVTPWMMRELSRKLGKDSIPYLIASLYTSPEYAIAAERSLTELTGENDNWGFRDWNDWWAAHKEQGMPTPEEVIRKVRGVSVSPVVLRRVCPDNAQ